MLLSNIDDYRTEDALSEDEYLTDDEQAIADALKKHGDAFRAYYSVMHTSCNDVDDIVDGFPDAYMGAYDSFKDFAKERAEEEMCMRIEDEGARDWVREYFDYKYYAKELEHDYFYEVVDGKTYVFLNI